ncbi:DVU0298 family protein [Chloroflexota bacterium]
MDDSLRTGQSNNKSPQQQVYALLLQRDFSELADLCEKDKRFWRILWATLYHEDESLRWPAIEAAAGVMVRWWQAGNKESVREYVRRLLWSMCDEAGEMGWSAPQTIAEIIASIPELLEPYGSMMISRSFEEPVLVAGGLWGIGRLGTIIREVAECSQDKILEVFHTDDFKTLGIAAWAMGEVGLETALPYLEKLKSCNEMSRIYINSDFCQRPVSQWAQEAIVKIGTRSMAS